MSNNPKPHLGFEFNENLFHLTPTLFLMRGEYPNGQPAGLMIGLTWLGATLSIAFC